YSRDETCVRRIGRVRAGVYMPSVYPEYVTEKNLIICPSAVNIDVLEERMTCPGGGYCQNDCVADPAYGMLDVAKIGNDEQQSYYYYGYVLDTDGAFAVLNMTIRGYATNAAGGTESTTGSDYASHTADPLRKVVDQALSSDYDPSSVVPWATLQANIDARAASSGLAINPIPRAEGTAGGTTLRKIKEGMERFMITDINNPAAGAQAQSTIAVMWDRIVYVAGDSDYISRFNHIPGGCNVLFMDGHVEFKKYPQPKFPVTAAHAIFGRT